MGHLRLYPTLSSEATYIGVGGNESHPELKELGKYHKRKQPFIYKVKSSPSNCNYTITCVVHI